MGFEGLWVQRTKRLGEREGELITPCLVRGLEANREGLSASRRWHGRLERHAFMLLARSGVLHFNPPLMDLETVPRG
jgi:hypothetical protein